MSGSLGCTVCASSTLCAACVGTCAPCKADAYPRLPRVSNQPHVPNCRLCTRRSRRRSSAPPTCCPCGRCVVVGAVENERGGAGTATNRGVFSSSLSVALSRCMLTGHHVPLSLALHRLARPQVPALGWLIPRQRKALEVGRQGGLEGVEQSTRRGSGRPGGVCASRKRLR